MLDTFTGFIPTSTPALRWSAAVAGAVGSRVILGPQGTLLVGDKGKQLTALRRADGAVLWRQALNYPTTYGSPAVDASGNTYAASWREISGFSPTGQRLWRAPMDGICQAPLQVGDAGDLYCVIAPVISGTTSKLLALSTADGSVLWSVTLPDNRAAQSAPALAGGGVVVAGSDNGDLYYIQSGEVLGSLNLGASVRSNPVIVRDRTGLVSQAIVATGANNDPTKHRVLGIDLSGLPPALAWSFCPTEQGSQEYLGNLTSPVLAPGGLIYAGFNGHLWLIKDGVERARCRAANLAGPIAVDGQGNAVVSRERGDLVAVDTSGEVLWALDQGGQGAGVAIDEDGALYVGTADGRVLCYAGG